jgi:hypothetical protein
MLELDDHRRLISALKRTLEAQRDEIAEHAVASERPLQSHKSELEKLISQSAAEKQILAEISRHGAHRTVRSASPRPAAAECEADIRMRPPQIGKLFDSELVLGKLQKELAGLTERVERDARLHEAAITAATLNLEAVSERHEGERRKLFAFAAEHFREFCDISQNMTTSGASVRFC